jgi:flagellar hook-length control protein FliK
MEMPKLAHCLRLEGEYVYQWNDTMTTAATLLFDTALPAGKPAAAISGASGQTPFAALLAGGGVLQVSDFGQLVAANAPVSGAELFGPGGIVSGMQGEGTDGSPEDIAGLFALLDTTALTTPLPAAKIPGGILGAAPTTPDNAPTLPTLSNTATAAPIVPGTGSIPTLTPISDTAPDLVPPTGGASETASIAATAKPMPAVTPGDRAPLQNARLPEAPVQPVTVISPATLVVPRAADQAKMVDQSAIATVTTPRSVPGQAIETGQAQGAVATPAISSATISSTETVPVADPKPTATSPAAALPQSAEVSLEKGTPAKPAPSLVASLSGNVALVATESRFERPARPTVPVPESRGGNPAIAAARSDGSAVDPQQVVPTPDSGINKIGANGTGFTALISDGAANSGGEATAKLDSAALATIVEATDQGTQTRGLSDLRPDSVTPAPQQSVRATAAASELIAQHDRPATPVQPPAEQVAIQLRNAIARGIDRLQIQLKPASLGLIDVTLDISSTSRVAATVTVERADTLDLLQRDARGLERALQDAGLRTDSGSLNFNLRDSGQQTANNGFAPTDGGDGASDGDSGETVDGGDNDQPESHLGSDRALDIAV